MEQTVYKLDDGKEYVLIEKKEFNDKEYVYLVDIETPQNIMFCVIEGTKLTKVTDQNEIGKLILFFAKGK